MTAIKRTDTPVVFEGDGVEVRMQEIGGDLSVAFIKFPAGTDMAPALKGLQDDLCQSPHWGYVFKGRVRMRRKDGSHDYKAGEAFYWAPGHAPEALEDSEFIDFSPTDKFGEVIDHVKAQMS
ncbi:hypothetical protein SGFS_061110 [Streptomyces graminofaciens]|uniref:Cupin domain-containing protein n=1 Tax=Streptomyces graminofaciens TaxID=68212 RepID=A0ABM7FCR5_9ACTN|nr:hypothetical protein [Streptomyces graminofaciens]BBC34817.1 hypothetical protein SGFS_061110 [Streptomyces graminofaciens]